MNKTKRSIGFIMVVVFVVSLFSASPVFALDYKYGYFPDVESNHWARQVITKMNLRGVAGGFVENNINYFKPDQNVTQLQAVLFAVRTMGLEAEDDSAVIGRYIPFSIPAWVSKGTIVAAVDAGLIVGNSFDCDKTATRAWVAQLLVRMLDKEGELSQVAGETLPFKDSSQVPSEYLNYVKLANKYGLIAGNPDNTFAPNQPVTSAQILSFLSRVEKHLELRDSNLLIGTITEINGNNVGVRSNGQDYTLITNISSNLYGPTGEIWSTDLRVNDQVYLIVDGNIVKYLEVGNFNQNYSPVITTPSKATGVIMQVFVEEKTLIIRTNEGKVETITISDATTLVNDNNQPLTLKQLVKDMEINVNYSNGKPIKVTVLTKNVLAGDEGIVFNINKDIKLITLKKGDNLEGYLYNEDTEVLIGNNRFGYIEDIKEGDQVKIKATDGLAESIQLVAAEVELSNSGTVQQITVDSRLLTYEVGDKEFRTFYVDPKATIDISGDSGVLGDLRKGDKIIVNVENGQITKISVTNRKLYEKMQGILVGNDINNRIITFRDSNNELQVAEVSSGADIRVNNKKAYLSNLQKDMQLEIELSDDKITYLNAKDTLLGTVVGINTGTKVMELTLTTGERKTYNIASNSSIYMEGITNYDLDDIARGDIVEVKIDNGRITNIKVQRAVTYEITEISTSSNRIRVKDSKNNSRYLYLYSDVELDIYGKSQPSIKDFNKNDIIKATYLGYTLQKVEMAPITIGTIASLDSSGKTIVVKGYDGQSHSFKFENNSRIIKDGYSYTTMGSATVGSRVVVKENIDGGRNFSLMSKVSGTVGFLYADKTKVFLKQTQTTWIPYDMVPTAYLHNGSIELTPGDIKTDDNVDLFIANNIVYEVLKK